MKKRITALFLAILMLVGLSVTALAESGKKEVQIQTMGIRVVVNGQEIVPQDANGDPVEPFAINGTTYLPIRAIGSALGLEVGWEQATKTVLLTSGGEVKTGSGTAKATNATVTGTIEYMDIKLRLDGELIEPKDVNGNVVEPFAMNGTTYLPIRAVASALGLEVGWEQATKTVTLGKTSGTPAADPTPAASNKVWAVKAYSYGAGSDENAYTYDAYGNITRDDRNTYEYEYDAAGRVTKMTRTWDEKYYERDQYEYNAQGLVAKKSHIYVGEYSYSSTTTDTTYEYDAAGRVTREAVYSGSTLLREYLSAYDAAGRLIGYDAKGYGDDAKTSYADHDVYTYTADGKPLTMTKTNAAGETAQNAAWTYDAAGRLTRMALTSYGETKTYDYTYTAEGRVSTCTDAKGTVYSFTWRADGTLEKAHLEPGEGVYFPYKADYYFNEAGQLTRKDTYSRGTTTVNETDTMTYDENGNLVSYLNERLTKGTMKRNYGTDYTYELIELKDQPAGSAVIHNYATKLPGYGRDHILDAILSYDLFSQDI